MKQIKITVCAILIAALIMVPFAGCSSKSSSAQTKGSARTASGEWGGKNRQKTGDSSKSGTSSGTDSSSNVILGKVTSIIGNQVILAIGTQSDSASSSSSDFTLTGESKTLLIPVGLTLSSARQAASGAIGTTSGSGTQGGGMPPTGDAPTGAAGGTATTRSSASTRTGTSTKSSTSTRTSSTITKTGFSSITEGEILRITQKTVNGTLTVVKVSVVSKSSS